MSPLMFPCACPDRQRGAIGLFAALTMALALLCTLVVVDSGRLFLEKRTLQRVADMAVLEAASLGGNCTGNSTASTYAIQSATRNGFTVTDTTRVLTTLCGALTTGTDSRRSFTADATRSDAIQVTVSHTVARSVAAGIGAMFDSTPSPTTIQLTAVAVATPPLPPLAQLTIRSTLATVDSTKGDLLNALWGGLLGGTLNVSLAGWQGLTNANINMLGYLNQLAVDVGVKAGDYTSLLGTDIAVSQLLNTAVKVLPQSNPAVQAAITNLLGASAIAGGTKIKLQGLMSVQNGLPQAALDTSLNLFQLVEAFVQVANSNSAVTATVPANLMGVAGATVQLKIIEPPQLTALGNPILAKANPTGPNQIFVKTAQVRILISVDLGPGLSTTLTALNTTLSTLGLTLLGADVKMLPNGSTVDISLDAAQADSYVTDFSCDSDATKTLTTSTTTAALVTKIGTISNKSAWTSSSTAMSVQELPILDIGTTSCTPLTHICQARVAYGGGGLGLYVGGSGQSDGSVMGVTQTFVHPQPAEIHKDPAPYQTFKNDNLVSSLNNTFGSVHLVYHKPTSVSLLATVLAPLTSILTTVQTTLAGVINGVLAPLVDPILNQVLTTLGVNLAAVDVGPNLSCHPAQGVLVI